MYLTKEKKEEIFAQYGKSVKDTGSTEGQIALFTYRIQNLTELMKLQKQSGFSLCNLFGIHRRLNESRDFQNFKKMFPYIEEFLYAY